MSLYTNTINRINAVEDKDKKIGSDFMDKVLESITSTWDLLDEDTKNNLTEATKMLGDSYQYAREFKEPLNPVNLPHNIGATGARVLEGIGYVSDKTIGDGVRFLADKGNIDPRLAEIGAFAAQIYGTPKALRGATNLTNKAIASKQAHNLVFKAGQFADETLGSFKPPSQRTINIKDYATILDETWQIPSQELQRIVKLAKQPGINSFTLAKRLNEQQGIINQYLKKFGYKPVDLQNMQNIDQLDLGIDDVGIPGYTKSSIKKISTPEFIDKRFREYGFTKLGPNGGWILDPKVYNSLKDHQKREIAQIMQTDISQTVPHSFSKEVNVKNLDLNTKLAEYNKKYGARAELHHDFPSALDARFWFNVEYMSDEWKILKSVANEYGNFPGQPMVEGQTNLVSLPSKIGKNHPNYHIVQKRYGRVPPHLHNIIHSQFFANETGMSGDKFFTPARVNKMEASFEGKVEVFREWNEIVARNSELWTEGLRQLDVFFGEIPLENADDLTRMLEEYLANNLIKLGSGNVKDRFGNLVKTKDGKLVTVDYSQFSVQDIVKNSLADFKADFKNDILGKNPRFKEAETEVKNFSQLSEGEVLDMANVLYKIKHYNGLKMIYGTRKAGEMVFGVGTNVKHYKEHLELYMGLIDDILPNDTPTITTLKQLKQTTFKDLVKPTFTEQIEILFPDTQLNLDL